MHTPLSHPAHLNTHAHPLSHSPHLNTHAHPLSHPPHAQILTNSHIRNYTLRCILVHVHGHTSHIYSQTQDQYIQKMEERYLECEGQLFKARKEMEQFVAQGLPESMQIAGVTNVGDAIRLQGACMYMHVHTHIHVHDCYKFILALFHLRVNCNHDAAIATWSAY